MHIQIIIAALAIMLASLSGIIVAWKKFDHIIEKNLPYFATFSTGVFLVIAYTLIVETTHIESSLLMITGTIVAGVIILELASRAIPQAHHHHEPLHADHKHDRIDARRMILGDAIHNFGDGILLVPAFLIDVRVGVATTVAIFIHEFIQELAEFFVLREAGYTSSEALKLNFLVSSSILAGVMVSLFTVSIDFLVAPLIGIAAGGFLYIIFRDLIPHTFKTLKRGRSIATHIFAILLGILVMVNVTALTQHEHDEHIEDVPLELSSSEQ